MERGLLVLPQSLPVLPRLHPTSHSALRATTLAVALLLSPQHPRCISFSALPSVSGRRLMGVFSGRRVHVFMKGAPVFRVRPFFFLVFLRIIPKSLGFNSGHFPGPVFFGASGSGGVVPRVESIIPSAWWPELSAATTSSHPSRGCATQPAAHGSRGFRSGLDWVSGGLLAVRVPAHCLTEFLSVAMVRQASGLVPFFLLSLFWSFSFRLGRIGTGAGLLRSGVVMCTLSFLSCLGSVLLLYSTVPCIPGPALFSHFCSLESIVQRLLTFMNVTTVRGRAEASFGAAVLQMVAWHTTDFGVPTLAVWLSPRDGVLYPCRAQAERQPFQGGRVQAHTLPPRSSYPVLFDTPGPTPYPQSTRLHVDPPPLAKERCVNHLDRRRGFERSPPSPLETHRWDYTSGKAGRRKGALERNAGSSCTRSFVGQHRGGGGQSMSLGNDEQAGVCAGTTMVRRPRGTRPGLTKRTTRAGPHPPSHDGASGRFRLVGRSASRGFLGCQADGRSRERSLASLMESMYNS